MAMVDILVALVGGAIVGLLGKAVAPGDRDNIPLWLTIICGIGGVVLGTFLWVQLGGNDNEPGSFDFFRHVTQIVVAAVLVMFVAGHLGRRTAA